MKPVAFNYYKIPNLIRPMFIQDSSPSDESVEEVLNEGDIYDPEPDKEAATNPRARIPMKPKQFILLETPYIGCLRYEIYILRSSNLGSH